MLQAAGFQRCDEYLLHRLQLDATADTLFRQFHKSSVQYRVRRAERLGLVCETGRSPKLIRDFFHLMALTRRRQYLPPQPFAWFENLVRCMGEDGIDIRVAYKDQRPVAAVLNVKAFGYVCYKYSCFRSSLQKHERHLPAALAHRSGRLPRRRRSARPRAVPRSTIPASSASSPTGLANRRASPTGASRLPSHSRLAAAHSVTG